MEEVNWRKLRIDAIVIRNEGDRELADIIAAETERQRRWGGAVASVVPEESSYTESEIHRMSWDELLIYDGECFIRCCERSGLPPRSVLEFVEVNCRPENRVAVRWFHSHIRLLTDTERDPQVVMERVRAAEREQAASKGALGGKAKAVRYQPIQMHCLTQWRQWLEQGEPPNKSEFARNVRPTLKGIFPPEHGHPEITDERTIIRWLAAAGE